jgi:hypothetical protein
LSRRINPSSKFSSCKPGLRVTPAHQRFTISKARFWSSI